MNTMDPMASTALVASLHLHPAEPGQPLLTAGFVELVAGKGIQGDTRYFEKISRHTGQQTRRQVSLIEREQIAAHAAALDLDGIAAGAVRSNIETTGIDLVSLVGREIQIGQAVLFLYERRDPCAKMDALCEGLRRRMMDGHQGVLAEVRRSGRVCLGDVIRIL